MPTKLALAFHLDGDTVVAAAASFDDWPAREAERTYTARTPAPPKPPRGELDLRALPALLELLHAHQLQPDTIVMEAPVHLDAADTPGLGRHLHDGLGGRVAVVGVTKTAMPQMPAQFEVVREEEAAPVIVTCIGVDLGAAKVRVRSMHGKRRLPTLLKLVARLAKGGGD